MDSTLNEVLKKSEIISAVTSVPSVLAFEMEMWLHQLLHVLLVLP